MRNFSLTALLAVCSYVLPAQTLHYAVANPYVGIAAYSSTQRDAFGFTANQAALAGLTTFAAGVYGERRFMLAENSSYAAALAMPTTLGNVGLQLNYAGFDAFNETRIGIAYGKRLGRFVDVGVQFNYNSFRMAQYGNASAINFEAGVIMHLTDKLNAGIYTYSPVGGRLGKTGDEEMAGIYKLGLGYDVSPDFLISTEIVKEEEKPVNVNGGIQYRYKQQFFLRTGFRSDNSTVFGGAGIAIKAIRVDVGTSYHPQLGFSPCVMLLTNFKQKANE